RAPASGGALHLFGRPRRTDDQRFYPRGPRQHGGRWSDRGCLRVLLDPLSLQSQSVLRTFRAWTDGVSRGDEGWKLPISVRNFISISGPSWEWCSAWPW